MSDKCLAQYISTGQSMINLADCRLQTEDCRLQTTESADPAVQTEYIFSNTWHASFRFCSYKIEFCILGLVVA